MKSRILSVFLILLFIFTHFNYYAYALMVGDSDVGKNLPNIIYYDADDSIKANKETGYIELNNHASFLIGNLYITAKKIIILKNENLITAEGDVKLIFDKEKATASKIVVDANTKQIRMDNAQIFSDPTATDDKVSKEVLGLSKAEIAFDKDRTTRTKEIESQLKILRDDYSNLQNLKSVKHNDAEIDDKINSLVVHYGQLLARYSRTQYQPNAYLAAIPELERDRFLKRREAVDKFNRENPDITNQIVNFTPLPSYISVAASQIIQKDKDTFILNNSIITPCHCSSLGEPPIYGFSSQNAQIDVGNYVTLQGATFDLFTMPLFYMPWFKLSIKNKRETGFLYPSGYTSNNAGSAITVPFFIVLGDHADSTVTYRNFSDRGSQFETEFRTQVNEDTPEQNQKSQLNSSDQSQKTQFYSLSNYIQDKKYSNDFLINSKKINDAEKPGATMPGTGDPVPANIEDYRGKNLSSRWYTEESLNLPISYWGSIKANGQFVSDNTYLGDFSTSPITDPTQAVTGNTGPSSKRFLAQEVDAEYYGDNSVLSVRGQGQQDLFSQTQTNTPMRLPRVEYTLLPARYFNSPFVFSNNSTWETVLRPGGGQNYLVPLQQTNATPTTVPTTPPGQKDPSNPYVEGKRFYTTSTISLPLPANDYVNAYAAATATGVQYYFPAADPYGAMKPYQGYMQYTLNTDLPIYSRYDFKNSENKITGSVTQTFDPYINLTYIPNVKQGYNFPSTYNLWYLQDSMSAPGLTPVGTPIASQPIATSAYLTVGASTSWRIQKRKYSLSPNLIDRFLNKPAPNIANLNYLGEVIKEKKLDLENNPEAIFKFSSEIDANKVFAAWAKKELDGYYKQVLLEELNQKYTWPNNPYYEFKSDLDITPVTLSVYTSYNFLAEKTAEEQNSQAGPIASPFPVESIGNIVGDLTWNLNPFAMLNGIVHVEYSQLYHRLSNASATFNTTLYNVGLTYTHALQYVLPTTDSVDFVEKTQDSAGITYSPLKWLMAGFNWSYSVDPTAAGVDSSDGRPYGSSYFINIMGIQDCLDMIIARNKPAGTPESQATYLIGINLKIFGYPTGNQYIGDYINRSVQEQ